VSLCPICKKEAAPRGKNNAFPFCCTRCRQVDLGKWLDEEYRVATIDAPGGQDGSDGALVRSESAPGSARPTEKG
jgi:endogenous inhibitor of DNA gyrase (YacG/DUF329 family)